MTQEGDIKLLSCLSAAQWNSLSLPFYLLYLFWNNCDGNDAFWRHTMLAKQSISFSFLSLDLWQPNSADLNPVDHQIWGLMQERVHKTPIGDTSEWSSALLTHDNGTGPDLSCSSTVNGSTSVSRTSSTKLLVNGENVQPRRRSARQHWTSDKSALFRANTLHNRLFSEPPTVYRGKHSKHIVSRHFRRRLKKKQMK